MFEDEGDDARRFDTAQICLNGQIINRMLTIIRSPTLTTARIAAKKRSGSVQAATLTSAAISTFRAWRMAIRHRRQAFAMPAGSRIHGRAPESTLRKHSQRR